MTTKGSRHFTGDKAEAKAKFLVALAKTNSSVTMACEAGGIRRATIYAWRQQDEDFAKAWDSALEEGTDRLEEEAARRALNGSDVLLIFLLKARRKEKYADLHRQWHSGPGDEAIKVEVEDSRPTIEALFSEFAHLQPPDEETEH